MLNPVELFSSYLTKEEGRSPQTAKQYSGDVRRFRAWLDAHPSGGQGRVLLEWEQITSAHIRAFLREQDFAPRRYHRFIASLRKFWAFLKDVHKLAVDNPALEVKRPKLETRMPVYLAVAQLRSKLPRQEHQTPNPFETFMGFEFMLSNGSSVQNSGEPAFAAVMRGEPEASYVMVGRIAQYNPPEGLVKWMLMTSRPLKADSSGIVRLPRMSQQGRDYLERARVYGQVGT